MFNPVEGAKKASESPTTLGAHENAKISRSDREIFARFKTGAEPFTGECIVAQASRTESIRFKAAGYKFWRFCLQREKNRTAFLKKIPPPELFELRHFADGVSELIYTMWATPSGDSDHDPLEKGRLMEFDERFSISGDGCEEGFFWYPYMHAIDNKKLPDVRGLSLRPILDGDNEKMRAMLENSVKETGTDAQS
ncbi:hypothetical protein K438DRAFT_1765887 [Mycena galopus ATCC 62051]|nr:hypothetical protein K438DRAFT_1765887 [Mycena galopus ATCC 62051]